MGHSSEWGIQVHNSISVRVGGSFRCFAPFTDNLFIYSLNTWQRHDASTIGYDVPQGPTSLQGIKGVC